MKQVFQNRRGETVVREVPPPSCASTDVLVRNAYSAISSGTERARVQATSVVEGARQRPELVREVFSRVVHDGVRPTVKAVRDKLSEESAGGYSSAGLVIETGAQVRDFSPGDRVACAGAGHANHAEVVAVPGNLCARVPDDVELRVAALTTIAAIALHALRLSDVRLGERVAVVGCGVVGQIALRLAAAAGAEVFALDLDPARVEHAVAAGANFGLVSGASAADELVTGTSGVGLDHVLVTAAADSPAPLLLALDAVRDRGSVTLVGDVPIEMPRGPLYAKELQFRVSRSYGPGRYDREYELHGLDYPIAYVRWTEQRNMEAVLELQARGRLSLVDLVEEVVPVAEAGSAFARLTAGESGRPVGAIVLEYGTDAEARPDRLPTKPRRAWAPIQGLPALGLIGAGGFACQVVVPAFAEAGARLALVAGGGGPSAERAVRKLGFDRYADSGEELIADPTVDAVAIVTRHADHAELTQKALLAGKHVFCEKPLALNEEELDDVLDAAQVSGAVLSVGFNRRFSPLVLRLAEFARLHPGPMAVVYRINAGRLPVDDWQNDLRVGGGRLVGEVCHFVDTIQFLAAHRITAVQCVARGDPRLTLAASDNLLVSLVCGQGSIGSIAYVPSGAPGIGKERLELFCAAGAGVIDDYRTLTLHGRGSVKQERNRTQDKGHAAEIRAFVDAMRHGVPPVPLKEIANSSRATLAAIESLRTGKLVSLDTDALSDSHEKT
jgi:predicted dehydrogenase